MPGERPDTAAPVARTVWADTDVEPGRRYAYALTALDNAQPPNESAKSPPEEVLVPVRVPETTP